MEILFLLRLSFRILFFPNAMIYYYCFQIIYYSKQQYYMTKTTKDLYAQKHYLFGFFYNIINNNAGDKCDTFV